jgi:hypothetical protein
MKPMTRLYNPPARLATAWPGMPFAPLIASIIFFVHESKSFSSITRHFYSSQPPQKKDDGERSNQAVG